MESVEQAGRTVEEAVAAALKTLAVTRDQVNVDILAHESRGLLGILGSPARVRVTLKQSGPAAEPSPPPSPSPTPEPRPPAPALTGPVSDLATASRDLLAHILSLMGVEATPELISDDEEGVEINVRTETDMGLLIGRHGQTLAALQLMVAMIANRSLAPEDRRRVILDVEGYRGRREIALRAMARSSADRAKRSGRPVRLDSLTSRERRIVHLALADDPDVTTRSEGEDPERVIIISPRSPRPGRE